MDVSVNNKLSRTEAFLKDKEFYAEQKDGNWCVFGTKTGFCYNNSLPNQEKARAYADELQNNKKNLYVD